MIMPFDKFLINESYDEELNSLMPILLEIISVDLFNDIKTIEDVQSIIEDVLIAFRDEYDVNAKSLLDAYPDVFEKVWNNTTNNYDYTLTLNGSMLVEESMITETFNANIRNYFKNWKNNLLR